MGKEGKSIIDHLMSMTSNIKDKDKFKIVAWNDDLPKELEQFKIESPPCAKEDNSYIK